MICILSQLNRHTVLQETLPNLPNASSHSNAVELTCILILLLISGKHSLNFQKWNCVLNCFVNLLIFNKLSTGHHALFSDLVQHPKVPKGLQRYRRVSEGTKGFPKVPKGPKGPKGSPKVRKGHFGHFGPKWPQMVPNGPKWSQMAQNGLKWSQMAQNGPKWSQMAPNCSKSQCY